MENKKDNTIKFDLRLNFENLTGVYGKFYSIKVKMFLMISSFFILGFQEAISGNLKEKKCIYNAREGIRKIDRNMYYLDFNGKVIQARGLKNEKQKKLDSASVVLLNEHKEVVGIYYSNKAGLFRMKLPLNRRFTIRVSKKGWTPKIILIDTRVSRVKNGNYYFPFDVFMFEDIPSVDVSILNEPIASVIFNDRLNRFYYNRDHTDYVNETLRKLYVAYYRYRSKHDTLLKKSNKENAGYVVMSVKRNVKEDKPREVLKQEDGYFGKRTGSEEKTHRKELEETDRNSNHRIVFKIQILSLEGRIPMCAKVFERCGKVNEYIHNNEYKYTIGEFSSLEGATNALRELKRKGYEDAFPIAFDNGKRITVTEATKLIMKTKVGLILRKQINNYTNKFTT